jgi:CHAD domain-containing protein
MAYRLRREESVTHGLRRLARKELASARESLGRSGPADESIHETRKSIKKVRAIVELIDSDDGRGLGGCRKRLRRVNRALSRLRDADAMPQALDNLEKLGARVDEHTLARLRRQLRAHQQTTAAEAADAGVWARADRTLRRVRRDAKGWRPAHHGFGALAAGIRTTLTQGRKALERAQKRRRAADFHEWRKRLKALRHQLRLLEGCSADVRQDVRRLHAAERRLGEDHNVAVLCAVLATDGSPADLEPLRQTAVRYQDDLRKRALDDAAPFYARSRGDYVRQLERAWKAWRSTKAKGRGRRRRAA